MDVPESLPDELLREFGIDAAAPFSTCRRVAGAPIDVRHGDTRIERSRGGAVTVSIGFYADEAQRQRRQWGVALAAVVRQALREA